MHPRYLSSLYQKERRVRKKAREQEKKESTLIHIPSYPC